MLQHFQATRSCSESGSDLYNTVATTSESASARSGSASSSCATAEVASRSHAEVHEIQNRLELMQRCNAAEALTLELEAQLRAAEESKLSEIRIAESLLEQAQQAEENVARAQARAVEAERFRDEAEASNYWRLWRSEVREAAAENDGSKNYAASLREKTGLAQLQEVNAQLEARLVEADVTLEKSYENPVASFGAVRLQAEASDIMEGYVELKRQRRWVIRYVIILPALPAYLVYGETREQALLASRGDSAKERRVFLAQYEVQYAGTDKGMHLLSLLPLASGRPRYLLRFEHKGTCDGWLGSLQKAKIGASSFVDRLGVRVGVRDWAIL